jgi:hypothetical protein
MNAPRPLTNAPRLPLAVAVVLAVQVVLAVGFAVLTAVASRGADGFGDLARFAGLLLGGVYLVGVGVAWLLARFVARGTVPGVVVAVVTPPVALGLLLVVLRSRG